MKQKQLEIELQKHVKAFEKPKIDLEQYHTPANIAATVVHCMYGNGDVEGRSIVDLGCGTGMLSIACCLMGAESVVGVDMDEDALGVMKENMASFEEGTLNGLSVVHCEVKDFKSPCDVVVMNPPFGTRVKGADMMFLQKASEVASSVVYSMHKTSTRKHVEKAGTACGLVGKPIAQLRYNLDKTYDFHKKKSVDVEVDLWRFERA